MDNVEEVFLDVLSKHAPLTKIEVKGNNLPYIDSETRRLIRQRDYLKKKANQTGSKYVSQAFQQVKYKVQYIEYEISELVITETKSRKTRRT